MLSLGARTCSFVFFSLCLFAVLRDRARDRARELTARAGPLAVQLELSQSSRKQKGLLLYMASTASSTNKTSFVGEPSRTVNTFFTPAAQYPGAPHLPDAMAFHPSAASHPGYGPPFVQGMVSMPYPVRPAGERCLFCVCVHL